ncbi:dTDP-glucose 4,6-dehydratase [Iodidimonas muriae]|uniref:dTDP-glucose 4,6-dehydratase n=2 Tax=Iodidimonas muriae TaxID=261467 RepID=A0ABQ2LBG7_9PROT|nr:dTDP-glucose 4,6-dehydratase [Kordiimonadales bacterium JCM 17843]GGO09330.1 dTDP-glucose 4,6-dehydratase [Iodidimonas muriae]
MGRHMQTFLVTGGAGFIGANFVHFLKAHNPASRIVLLDALTYAGNRASIADLDDDDGFVFIKGDIGDYDLVCGLLSDYAVDAVVHFAAESHVDRSIHNPDAFIQTNVVGTHILLRAAKKVWLDTGSGRPHRFHHISTDEVFGSLGPSEPAFHEGTPYAPNSPYSASKAASDHFVRAYHHTYGLDVTISNCSNNYGPYQFPEKLIPLFLINALHGKPLPVYGDGANIRDWLHVEDHCRAIHKILMQGTSGAVYAVGGNCELTNLALIDQLCAEIDAAFVTHPSLAARFPDAPPVKGKPTQSLKRFVEDRLGHDRRYAIDARKIKRELGFDPAYDFTSGLKATINWYLEHESWWRALLDGRYNQWIDKQYIS